MLSFPEDIEIDILTRLPVKSLLRCRCVSKSWCKLIKSANFVKHQLNHSLKYGDHGVLYNNYEKIFCVDYDSSSSALSITVVQFDYPSEHVMHRILSDGKISIHPSKHRIICSCNGLVCYISSQENIIIWNPYTKDYRIIPTPPETESREVFPSYEFGYDMKLEDYKVARMENIPGKYTEISIYSLKLDLWKTFRDIPSLIPSAHLVFFEGILHWVDMSLLKILRKLSKHLTICSLDIGTGAFKEIPPPQYFSSKFNKLSICVLGGCLCLTESLYQTCSEVWLMKDYGVHDSWTKMFTIDNSGGDLDEFGYLSVKQSFKTGVILIQVDSSGYYLYDLKHKKFTKLEINGRMVMSFLGTLVSPNNLSTCMEMQ